jgi:hypothetical protein
MLSLGLLHESMYWFWSQFVLNSFSPFTLIHATQTQPTTFPQLSELIKQWQFWVDFGMILARFPAVFWIKYGKILWTILGQSYGRIWADFGPVRGPIMGKLLGRFWSDFEDDFGDEFVLVWGQF